VHRYSRLRLPDDVARIYYLAYLDAGNSEHWAVTSDLNAMGNS
jgi:hypothetical protein